MFPVVNYPLGGRFLPNDDNTRVTITLGELIESELYYKEALVVNNVKWYDTHNYIQDKLFPVPIYKPENGTSSDNPLLDEAGMRETILEHKVIQHFWTRQIGQETPALFLQKFRARWMEIQPYYTQLWKSELIMDAIEDPFGNVDIVETFEQETTGQSEGSATSAMEETRVGSMEQEAEKAGTAAREHKFSNTPQGEISNLDSYMTEASVDNDTTTESTLARGRTDDSLSSQGSTGTTTTSSGTVKHTYTKKGNHGVNTYAHDMMEFRQTFLNIDAMVIADLECLFLMVY